MLDLQPIGKSTSTDVGWLRTRGSVRGPCVWTHRAAPYRPASSASASRYRPTDWTGGRYIPSICPIRCRLTRSTLASSVCVAPATVRRMRRSRPLVGCASADAIAPRNTDQVGHSVDRRPSDVEARLGGTRYESDGVVDANLRRAQQALELLAGRGFANGREATLRFDSGGLPFVEVPDLVVARSTASDHYWPIPDPVRPTVAQIVQTGGRVGPRKTPASTPTALARAGEMVAACARDNDFGRSVSNWLERRQSEGELAEVLSQLVDADRFVAIPVAAGEVDGWWFQITRRLRLINAQSEDNHRLVEPIAETGDRRMLVALEPTLIIARVTEHPSTWAMAVRIWPFEASMNHGWHLRGLAQAVHRHGIPVITVDERTTSEEAAAQLLLAAYWYGYLEGDADAVPDALSRAFPRAVRRVQSGTGADQRTAATMLFARLLNPGFDPGRTAETMRHYVARHATTIVRQHRAELGAHRPWKDLDISERHYYRLVGLLASKGPDGRYEMDDATRERLKVEVARRRSSRQRRQAACELLIARGFSKPAARKWLQRHPIEDVLVARPRGLAHPTGL